VKEHGLVEYLYIDEARIDSYFEQISDPVKYDKVPVWKSGLALTGISVEAAQSRPQRPFTMHEKIITLRRYLQNEKLLADRREVELHWREQGGTLEKPYFSERISARRMILKPGTLLEDTSHLAFWYSETEESMSEESDATQGIMRRTLLLIEDYFGGDDNRLFRFSGASMLTALTSAAADRYRATLQLDEGPNEPPRKIPFSKNTMRSFSSNNPLELLLGLGATLGPVREVSALYRLRQLITDRDASLLVGYPIVITA
jgi:hypothetical protein